MSQPVETPSVTYQADGIVRTFDFTFFVPEPGSSDIQGIVVYLTVGFDAKPVPVTDYTLTFIDPETRQGGRVTFNSPPSAGNKVTIQRDTPISQTRSFENGVAFFAEEVEGMGDRSAVIDQELMEKLGRAVLVPPGSDIPADQLIADLRADRIAAEAARAGAEAARDRSEAAANAAKTSENNAAQSASDASTSETNANTSALNSKSSETNAANSALDAAGSADRAEAAAARSETAANAAKTSENNAAQSASDASTSETNAKSSETNAYKHEISAEAAAFSARQSSSQSQEIYEAIKAINPLDWKGEWDTVSTYTKSNVVYHNGSSWVCSVDSSMGNEPSLDSTDWNPVALRGSKSPALMPVIFNLSQEEYSKTTMGVNGFNTVCVTEKDSDSDLISETKIEISLLADESIPAIQVPDAPNTVAFPVSFRGKAIVIKVIDPPSMAGFMGVTLTFEE